MAKNYTIDQSATTGFWYWQCKDGSSEGYACTKSEAKAAAQSACSAGYVITPPKVDATVISGYLATFSAKDLNNQINTFSVGEISENSFCGFFGLDCFENSQSSDVLKATTILKIWGIYRGGITSTQIKTLHYLNNTEFNKLIARQYFGLEITINDNGTISWSFPS